jgi:hypothetical protein
MRCLENNDKDYVMRKIEELVKNQCHDGRLIGKEVADKIRDLVHELWLRSDDRLRYTLLMMLKSLGVSKTWVKVALHICTKALNTWLVRCGINWANKVTRNEIIKNIEDVLRKEFGWSETRMCEEMW